MHDTHQRVFGRDVGQDLGERVAVCDVAGDGPDVGVEVIELGGLASSAAHQNQVSDAVLLHEVPGHSRAERATGTGDEHGAVEGGDGLL